MRSDPMNGGSRPRITRGIPTKTGAILTFVLSSPPVRSPSSLGPRHPPRRGWSRSTATATSPLDPKERRKEHHEPGDGVGDVGELRTYP